MPTEPQKHTHESNEPKRNNTVLANNAAEAQHIGVPSQLLASTKPLDLSVQRLSSSKLPKELGSTGRASVPS